MSDAPGGTKRVQKSVKLTKSNISYMKYEHKAKVYYDETYETSK